MIGQTLGHYRIIEKIGAGGMGEVYRARDERLKRDVALKLLPAETSRDLDSGRKLLLEAQSASALNDPHICTIHEVGEADGRAFIVMELVEGRSLDALIPPDGLPQALVVRYGTQIASALAHAHDRGIIHRDVKTENIVINASGQVKVLDFGLAKLPKSSDIAEATRSMESVTKPGAIVGTLAYMAPEVLRGEDADARSDVWSLGVALYEMAAGHRPFRGQTGYELSSSILREPAAPLAAQIPAGLRVAIERCLEKEPGHRYQRASEVRAALEMVQHSSELSPTASALTASLTASGPRDETRRRVAWTVGALAAVILVGILLALNVGGVRDRFSRASSSGPIQSLAVLPFTNENSDPQLEYLDDGLTENLINGLSRLPQLKVMSRNAVFRYKGKNADAQTIGNALGVRAVLTGTTREYGDSISVSAELVDTRDNSQLWGQRYTRKLADLSTLQDDLSRDISNQLKLRLSAEEQRHLSHLPTANPEAYQLYLKGNFFWNKKTYADHQRAIAFYQQAIEKDPTFALAHVGISNCYSLLPVNGNIAPSDAMPKAKEAALRALELDPNLAEAHGALARVLMNYEWNFPAAQNEVSRALELDPNSVNSMMWRVEDFTAFGQTEEAIATARRAIEVDPFSIPANGFLGRVYYFAGRYEEAVASLRKTVEMDQNAWFVHLWLGMPLTAQKDYAGAIAEFEKAGDVTYEPALRRIHAEALSGKKAEARAELQKFVELSTKQFVPALHIARVYAGLGEKDHAFEWLNRSYEKRDFLLIYLQFDPDFAGLRSDPRFQELVLRMKLPLIPQTK
jgi:eukaryotic-like serine/threonine-protein kinase